MTDWEISRIVRTMFPLLLVLSLLEIGSGVVLDSLETVYTDNPSLLVLVPVMIGMGGNLGSIFSSRLSTGLHLGTIELDPRDADIWANVGAVLALAATVFVLLGFAAYGIGVLSGGSLTLLKVLLVSVASGMTLAVVVILVSFVATYASYVFGLEPDDTVIPVVTNVCDISGVVILTAVILVVI